MNDTILLVGHGSREATGNAEILLFAQRWRARHPDWRIDVGFIEFADPLLDPALEQAARNSQRVLVLPLILNAAGHVRQDIPRAIQRAQKQHPDVQFLYAPHLAVSDPLLRILKRHLREAMLQLDVPDPRTTGVILLGRGSSDRLANGDVARMARWLWEIGDHERVDLAFTGVTFPRLEKVVRDQVALGMMQIIVMPYYLFTGTLIKRIARQMENLAAQYPQVRFAHTSYFGFEPEIAHLLDDRVHALRQGLGVIDLERLMRPDPFREEEGHHHHHGHEHGHQHGHEHTHAHDQGDARHHGHAHAYDDEHDHDHSHDHVHDAEHEHTHAHNPGQGQDDSAWRNQGAHQPGEHAQGEHAAQRPSDDAAGPAPQPAAQQPQHADREARHAGPEQAPADTGTDNKVENRQAQLPATQGNVRPRQAQAQEQQPVNLNPKPAFPPGRPRAGGVATPFVPRPRFGR